MATATGIYHRTYRAELALRHTRAEYARLILMFALLLAAPYLLNNYWLGITNTILIAVIGAVGLNILVGFTGQISLGQGGFLAVGAYASAILSGRAGLPVPVSVLLAVLLTAAVGAFFGLPALRLKGLYLAIATLASQEIIMFVVRRWEWLTEGAGYVEVARLNLFGWQVERETFEVQWYWILLGITVVAVAGREEPVPDGAGPLLHGGARPGHRGRGHRRQPHRDKDHGLRSSPAVSSASPERSRPTTPRR